MNTPRELLPEVRELLRRAILTCSVIPVERGPRGPHNSLANLIVHDLEDMKQAYGYQPPAAKRFDPTPRDVSTYMDLLGFLAWYQREYGKQKVDVFKSWALEVPMWLIGNQIRRGEDTVKRWRDGVALTISEQFTDPLKKMLEGACVECAACSTNHEHSQNSPLKTPNIWLAADNKPVAFAADIEGSPAAQDRTKTIRKLERNSKREQRRKRA